MRTVAAHYGGLPHARLAAEGALHVFGKDVQSLGGDDHLLLAAAHRQAAFGIHRADISGVKPAILEGSFGRRVEVSGGDVLAADEDLAIVRNAYLDSRDGFADCPLAGVERMVERHNRSRLREPVSL